MSVLLKFESVTILKSGYIEFTCDATPAVMLSPAVAMAITSQRDASCR